MHAGASEREMRHSTKGVTKKAPCSGPDFPIRSRQHQRGRPPHTATTRAAYECVSERGGEEIRAEKQERGGRQKVRMPGTEGRREGGREAESHRLGRDRSGWGCRASLESQSKSVQSQPRNTIRPVPKSISKQTCLMVILGRQSCSSFRMLRHTVPVG